jgi:P27 family predicted phage terminase small subunit
LKLLRGNPGKRALNPHEPEPQRTLPERPDWFDDDARATWDRIVPQLAAMGVLTMIDGESLVRYCRMSSRWKQAELFIAQHGETFITKDENGKVKYVGQLPQVNIASNLAAQLLRIEQEFGMTPSSRSRLITSPQAVKDELEAFLNRYA